MPAHPLVDEKTRWLTAQAFAHGDWRRDPVTAIWPTMPAIVGWTVALFGATGQLIAGRLVVFAFALMGLAGFFRLAGEFDAESAPIRTAQFFLSPIVLPYCVVVYSDIPALACLVWAAVGAWRRQHWLLIGFGALACVMRQSNIVWFVALFGVLIWRCLDIRHHMKARHLLSGALVVTAWIAVVWMQGGIAVGEVAQVDHPAGLRGISNVWFALLVAGIVYLPYFLFQLFADDSPPNRLWFYLFMGLTVVLTFEVKHRFNIIPGTYSIHSYLARWASQGNGLGVLGVVCAAVAVLAYRSWPADFEPLRLPFLTISALSLLPFWHIDWRYYLPVYCLYWAVRPAVDRRVEYAQVLFGALACIWLIVRINQDLNFP